MGPAIDFSVRRIQTPDEEMLKAALRRPKLAKTDVEKGLGKKRKNIETDEMGDRVGKLHLAKQDLSKMQGRKMKGLKGDRGRVGRVDKVDKPKKADNVDMADAE